MRIKTELENFYRDDESNALINTDVNAFTLYKQRRELKNMNSSLERELGDLKAEMAEMKKILMLLSQQNNKEMK